MRGEQVDFTPIFYAFRMTKAYKPTFHFIVRSTLLQGEQLLFATSCFFMLFFYRTAVPTRGEGMRVGQGAIHCTIIGLKNCSCVFVYENIGAKICTLHMLRHLLLVGEGLICFSVVILHKEIKSLNVFTNIFSLYRCASVRTILAKAIKKCNKKERL